MASKHARVCKTHSLSTSKLYHTITGATASADSKPQDHKSNLHFTCILISLFSMNNLTTSPVAQY